MREKIIKAIDNERKRYYKDMKGTQGKEEVREIIREVFAGAGLEIKELKRGGYKTLFSIEGKLII